MNSQQAKAFMNAIEAAGIKTFEFDSDLCTHFYHDGVHAIVKPNYDLECMVAFRANDYGGSVKRYKHNIQAIVSDFGDIHEVRTAGSFDQIKKFAEAIGGIDFTNDELKILVSIDNANYDIIPETGDYVNAFHYLSKKQIAELSTEERAEYEASLKEYEEKKKNHLQRGAAAQITY